MNDSDKLEVIADIFDCDPSELTPEMALDNLGWDSMAMLSVVALVRTKGGKSLTGDEVRKMNKVVDIMNCL